MAQQVSELKLLLSASFSDLQNAAKATDDLARETNTLAAAQTRQAKAADVAGDETVQLTRDMNAADGATVKVALSIANLAERATGARGLVAAVADSPILKGFGLLGGAIGGGVLAFGAFTSAVGRAKEMIGEYLQTSDEGKTQWREAEAQLRALKGGFLELVFASSDAGEIGRQVNSVLRDTTVVMRGVFDVVGPLVRLGIAPLRFGLEGAASALRSFAGEEAAAARGAGALGAALRGANSEIDRLRDLTAQAGGDEIAQVVAQYEGAVTGIVETMRAGFAGQPLGSREQEAEVLSTVRAMLDAGESLAAVNEKLGTATNGLARAYQREFAAALDSTTFRIGSQTVTGREAIGVLADHERALRNVAEAMTEVGRASEVAVQPGGGGREPGAAVDPVAALKEHLAAVYEKQATIREAGRETWEGLTSQVAGFGAVLASAFSPLADLPTTAEVAAAALDQSTARMTARLRELKSAGLDVALAGLRSIGEAMGRGLVEGFDDGGFKRILGNLLSTAGSAIAALGAAWALVPGMQVQGAAMVIGGGVVAGIGAGLGGQSATARQPQALGGGSTVGVGSASTTNVYNIQFGSAVDSRTIGAGLLRQVSETASMGAT